MGTTNTLDINNRVSALEKAVSGGDSAQANKADIATEFSATTAYTAGCFVYYQGKLYQFNTDHAAGAWDSTDVVEANVTGQIVSNKAAIEGLTASNVAYDNSDSGLSAADVQGAVDELRQADNIMMSDGVTSVEDALDELTANTLGTAVSIKGTSGYICPSDGYVKFRNDGSTTANSYLDVMVNGVSMISVYGQHIGYYEETSLFVKKGMTINDNGSTLSSYNLEFIPIS